MYYIEVEAYTKQISRFGLKLTSCNGNMSPPSETPELASLLSFYFEQSSFCAPFVFQLLHMWSLGSYLQSVFFLKIVATYCGPVVPTSVEILSSFTNLFSHSILRDIIVGPKLIRSCVLFLLQCHYPLYLDIRRRNILLSKLLVNNFNYHGE